jgi:hypothetical protein
MYLRANALHRYIVIAALKRCATQNPNHQNPEFPKILRHENSLCGLGGRRCGITLAQHLLEA